MKRLKLSITKPCPISDDMTFENRRYFCQVCSKQVVDFSDMSNHEIIDYLALNRGKSLCVNASDTQLRHGIPLMSGYYTFLPFLRRTASVTLLGISLMGVPVLVNGQEVQEPKVVDKLEQYKSEGRIIEMEIPAEYDTLEVQRLIENETVREVEIPAEYETITKKVMVRKGGMVEWREVLCSVPNSEPTIEVKRVKETLASRGYYKGNIDNLITHEFRAAVMAFKKDQRLDSTDSIDDNVLKLLGLTLAADR